MNILLKRLGWFGVATLVSILSQLGVTVFLLSHLTLAEYGEVGLFLGVVAITTPIITLGAENALARAIHDESVKEDQVGSAAVTVLITMTVILSFLVFISAIFFDHFDINFYLLAALAAASQALILIVLVQLQMLQRAREYGLLSLVNAIGLVFVTVLAFEPYGAYARYAAPMVSLLLVFIVSYALGCHRLFPSPFGKRNFSYVKEVGLPLTPHAIFGVTVNYGDRLILAAVGNQTVLGAYSVLSQILNIQLSALATLNNVYVPWLYERLNLNLSPKTRLLLFSLFVLSILEMIILGSIHYAQIVPETYQHITGALYLAAPVMFFEAAYMSLVAFLYYHKKGNAISAITLLQGAFRLTILLSYVNYFSPDLFGMMLIVVFGSVFKFCAVSLVIWKSSISQI